jgi:hypothetical protein
MNKAHLTLFALLVAGATVLGAVALTRTTGLGRAARHTNDAAITARTKQLETYAAKLRKELKARPPALPKVPQPKPAAPAVAPAVQQAAAPTIVYHRPPAIVTVIHTHHHGDDGGHESDGGGGGGGDD